MTDRDTAEEEEDTTTTLGTPASSFWRSNLNSEDDYNTITDTSSLGLLCTLNIHNIAYHNIILGLFFIQFISNGWSTFHQIPFCHHDSMQPTRRSSCPGLGGSFSMTEGSPRQGGPRIQKQRDKISGQKTSSSGLSFSLISPCLPVSRAPFMILM